MLGNSMYERLITNLKNTFTYEFWVQPESVHRIDKQSREHPVYTDGKNYIIGPGHGDYDDGAGISVSVGLNGITVFEQTKENIYAVLVHEAIINEPIRIAVVYDAGGPQLFVNGRFIKSGERSPKRYIYPSGMIGGQPGLFFNGDIKEIRLWDHRRTEKQLNAYLNKELYGSEEGLYGIWPTPSEDDIVRRRTESSSQSSQKDKEPSKRNKNESSKRNLKEKAQKDKKNKPQKGNSPSQVSPNNQGIEVSIIIPSFNKYPLNLFTLYALEHQTFNPSKMEVIFINDASTDQTDANLLSYSPPYHFKYIHSKEKLGRARVRNLGIRSASGRILIFLDAEMITEPNFVENHYKYHQSKNNVILSGAMHSKAIYTCVFPEFSKEKMKSITTSTKGNQEIYTRLQGFKYPYAKPFPLLEKSDISRKAYMDLSYKGYPWFQQITKNFAAGLDGFAFPWMAFLTGNVSIRKDFIEQAGGFDEDFYQYGYEDWELGYRLYKMGAEYIVSSEVLSYHQEHPVGEDKWKEAVGNFGIFTIKHHDIDVLILGLELSGLTDLLTMNKILNEYNLLVQSNPRGFQKFQAKFIGILETIILILEVDIRHFNILGAAGFSTNDRKELQEDINYIKNQNKYKNLTYFLEKVLNS